MSGTNILPPNSLFHVHGLLVTARCRPIYTCASHLLFFYHHRPEHPAIQVYSIVIQTPTTPLPNFSPFQNPWNSPTNSPPPPLSTTASSPDHPTLLFLGHPDTPIMGQIQYLVAEKELPTMPLYMFHKVATNGRQYSHI